IVDSIRKRKGAASTTRRMTLADGEVATYTLPPANVPDPDQLPDYTAPFEGWKAVRVDAEDNLWIVEGEEPRPAPAAGVAPEPYVYELVNRHGELFDRVQIPVGTSIVGFGPGVVYLSGRTGTKYEVIRVRIR
ncbi:MAG TPA: hypothetical protein VMH39_03340, partial [Gemmatimonadaceae bacterium]|nr:hypothetical protein [Gemmatimonadaceae bacterium]